MAAETSRGTKDKSGEAHQQAGHEGEGEGEPAAAGIRPGEGRLEMGEALVRRAQSAGHSSASTTAPTALATVMAPAVL
jgi:hypothetical protein